MCISLTSMWWHAIASHESREFADLWIYGSLSTCSSFINSYSSEDRRLSRKGTSITLGVLQEMCEGSAATSLVSS